MNSAEVKSELYRSHTSLLTPLTILNTKVQPDKGLHHANHEFNCKWRKSTVAVYLQSRPKDSLGFWIPPHELRIPVIGAIPESLSFIPNSKAQDSRATSKIFPDSKIRVMPYVG